MAFTFRIYKEKIIFQSYAEKERYLVLAITSKNGKVEYKLCGEILFEIRRGELLRRITVLTSEHMFYD